MQPMIWLRAASILTLIHSILHTVGGVFGEVPSGPAETAAAAMKVNTFVTMGVTRSYWQFYRGMGLGMTILLTLEAVALWLLGNVVRESDSDLRPVLAVFLVGYVAMAMNSWKYFFAAPVVVELLIAACIGGAIFAMKRQEA